jgi:hypothetical protein
VNLEVSSCPVLSHATRRRRHRSVRGTSILQLVLPSPRSVCVFHLCVLPRTLSCHPIVASPTGFWNLICVFPVFQSCGISSRGGSSSLIPRSGTSSDGLNRVSNLIILGVSETHPRFFLKTGIYWENLHKVLCKKRDYSLTS